MATLKDNSEKAKRQARIKLARGQNAAFDFVVSEARALAPVLSGFLKSKIRRTLIATPEKPRAGAESAAPYSGFVNSGTYKMAAIPFWTVALFRMLERFPEFFRK